MTPVLFIAVAVLTLLMMLHIASRMSARRPNLGTVSQSWLAEERASDSSRT